MAAQSAMAAAAADPAVVVAMSPNAVLAPAARAPFQPASETVAAPSAAVVRVPFHTWVTRAPSAGRSVTVQPRTGEAEVFRTVTSAWWPPCQTETDDRKDAVQVRAGSSGSPGSPGSPGVVSSCAASAGNQRAAIFSSPAALGCTPS